MVKLGWKEVKVSVAVIEVVIIEAKAKVKAVLLFVVESALEFSVAKVLL